MTMYQSFDHAIRKLTRLLLDRGYSVKPNNWQSMDVSKLREAEMIESLNLSFSVPIGFPILDHWRNDIKPNLPWADEHFELERASGEPINPGTTWKTWPWGLSADKFRTEGEKFSHSYAERYWPKFANSGVIPNEGIRYPYGDLHDVVDRLIADPVTRQAVLAVWFPEDQHNGKQRVPCSLFYHFINRGGYLHIIYTIRSCDALRHFRDDCYLTVRLLLWVLDQLQLRDPDGPWAGIAPGSFTMHITSFHCFIGDRQKLEESIK